MKRLDAIFQTITWLWERLWSWIRGKPIEERLFRVARIDEEPDHPAPRTLYMIEDAGQIWAALMSCPGGCGQVLHMNLIPDTKPVWQLTEHSDGTASLTPSVWRREGCGCHFWLRRGRIEWV
jgi:hypothetical protein